MKELKKLEKEILNSNLVLSEENNLVFGKGNPNAKIFFIGEAPGAKEDELGIPFVGAAGKELDKLLNSIELGIDDVYIANILKYRPPNNRDPKVDEIRNHTPFLVKQISIVNPNVICTLGNFATKFVLSGLDVSSMNKVKGISLVHGTVNKVNLFGKEYVVIPLYHPAAMLYNPRLRNILEEDFKVVKKLI